MTNTEPLRVSYSAVQDWRQCEQRYVYQHVDRLRPKIRVPSLQLGSLIHDYLAAYYGGVSKLGKLSIPKVEKMQAKVFRAVMRQYRNETTALAQTAEMLGEDGASVAKDLMALPDTAEALIRAYHRIHGTEDLRHHKVVMVEQAFEMPVSKGIVLPCRIDMVTRNREGYWLWEHKTTGNVPERGSRFRDLQTLLYAVVLEELHGIKISGVIWNYIRTKPPKPPDVLKNGRLSQRKDMITTRELYAEAAVKTVVPMRYYEPYLRQIEQRERTAMFPRYTLPLLQAEDVLLRDYATSAQRIEIARSGPTFVPVRNIAAHCDWCPYVKMCHAAITGGDSNELRRRYFVAPDDAEEGTDGRTEDEDDLLEVL